MQSISLYIHFPYCRRKCPYCDFTSFCASTFDMDLLLQGYRRDLEFFKKRVGDISLSTVFFGGGTPSLMHADQLSSLLDLVREFFPIEQDAEVSIEVNPATVNSDTLIGYQQAGVNRLSMGIQSLWESDLEFLGRLHNGRQNRELLTTATNLFPNRSADFMYALPHQTIDQWRQQLDQVIKLDLPHLSIYQLTVEEGTPFAKRFPIGVNHPHDEEMYQLTHDKLTDAGYEHYEISNFAKTGMRSRHNMVYWNGGQYIGIGVAAHSRLIVDGKWMEYASESSVDTWKNNTPHGAIISAYDRAVELFMMGLRTVDGVSADLLNTTTGLHFEDVLDMERVDHFVKEGMLLFHPCLIVCTKHGRVYLNHILSSLFKN